MNGRINLVTGTLCRNTAWNTTAARSTANSDLKTAAAHVSNEIDSRNLLLCDLGSETITAVCESARVARKECGQFDSPWQY